MASRRAVQNVGAPVGLGGLTRLMAWLAAKCHSNFATIRCSGTCLGYGTTATIQFARLSRTARH